MAQEERCPVCNSPNHIHCAKGCVMCDDPENPMPRYASIFCEHCGESFCAECYEAHLPAGAPKLIV